MRTKIAIALGIVYVVWGSTYLAIAVADRTLPPLLMLAVRFGLAGGLLYRLVRVARRRRRCAAGPARVDGRGDRRRAAPVRRHGRRRLGRAAGRLGPDRAPRRGRAALRGAPRPHVLRSPALARRARRDCDGAARRRAARRAERARRSRRRRGDPRRGVRVGGRLGLRPRRAAAARAVPVGRDADALRRRAARASREPRWARSAASIRRRSRRARSRRSASSSSSARSSPSPPTAGCCGAARRASSSRRTPTSTRRSPSCSAGRSRARRSAAASSRPARSSSPRSGCSSSRASRKRTRRPRCAGDGRPVPPAQGGAGAARPARRAAARRSAPHGALSDRVAPRYGGGMTTFDLRTLRHPLRRRGARARRDRARAAPARRAGVRAAAGSGACRAARHARVERHRPRALARRLAARPVLPLPAGRRAGARAPPARVPGDEARERRGADGVPRGRPAGPLRLGARRDRARAARSDPLPPRLRRPLPRLRQGSQCRAARARGGENRPALGEAQRAAAAGMTNGVVVVSGTKPSRSRIGRLVGSASE